MSVKKVGLVFVVFAAILIIGGEFIASIFTGLAALSLLILDKDTNAAIAKKLGKSEIRTYSNKVHYWACFLLFMSAGAVLPEPEQQVPVSTPVTNVASENDFIENYLIETPECVIEVVGRMNELWTELGTFRGEADFHQYRFTMDRYGNWNNERETLVNDWNNCRNLIASQDRGYFSSISNAVGGLYPLAQSWSANSGNDDEFTQTLTRDIYTALGANWSELYREI